MKCYICKKEGAKRKNKYWEDEIPSNWKKNGEIFSWHFACDDCFSKLPDVGPLD